MCSLQSPERPGTARRFVGGMVIDRRELDVARWNVIPRRQIDGIVEPTLCHPRQIHLKRTECIGIMRKRIDAYQLCTTDVVDPPPRPGWQQAIFVGETGNEISKCRPDRSRQTTGGRNIPIDNDHAANSHLGREINNQRACRAMTNQDRGFFCRGLIQKMGRPFTPRRYVARAGQNIGNVNTHAGSTKPVCGRLPAGRANKRTGDKNDTRLHEHFLET